MIEKCMPTGYTLRLAKFCFQWETPEGFSREPAEMNPHTDKPFCRTEKRKRYSIRMLKNGENLKVKFWEFCK